ncbi:MAG: hypothetical protein KatS3mg085_570 [Candidatus Dojkabacteria bacterium]|nr:MAG: hypothetical protein KatS3mg085_570 [Candidatus Dojkabacteria bacterium]
MKNKIYFFTTILLFTFVVPLFLFFYNSGLKYSLFEKMIALETSNLDLTVKSYDKFKDAGIYIVTEDDFLKFKDTFQGDYYEYYSSVSYRSVVTLLLVIFMIYFANLTLLYFLFFRKKTLKSFGGFGIILFAYLFYLVTLTFGVLSFTSMFTWIDDLSIGIVLISVLVNLFFYLIYLGEFEKLITFKDYNVWFNKTYNSFKKLILPYLFFTVGLTYLAKDVQPFVIINAGLFASLFFNFYGYLLTTFQIETAAQIIKIASQKSSKTQNKKLNKSRSSSKKKKSKKTKR